MKIFFFSFVLMMALLACRESDEERLSRLVKEWDGKERIILYLPFKVVIQFLVL